MGSVLSRAFLLAAGYGFPAYQCFKTVEKTDPDAHQLTSWCQYWILIAVFTVCERLADVLIPWFPLYTAAKLAFFLYIQCRDAQGTIYIYKNFVRPYVVKHEKEIDERLIEVKGKAWEVAALWWEKGLSCGHLRMFGTPQDRSTSLAPSQNEPTRSDLMAVLMAVEHVSVSSPSFSSDNRNSTTNDTEKSFKEAVSPPHRIWKWKILRHRINN